MKSGAADLAQAVVTLGRRVVAAGLVAGAGGNISVRTGPDEVLITPSGWSLDTVEPEQLVALGLDSGAVATQGARPSSEAPMHLATHRARPDLGIALHTHPPFANLLVATGRPIRLMTTDHAYYVRRFAQVPYLPSGTNQLGNAVAGHLSEVDTVLLAHHGCLTVAPDADLAYERAVNLEAAATATWRALVIGDTTTECPAQFLEHIEALEAQGITYGKARGDQPKATGP